MNKDKTVVYTGEVIIPPKDSDSDLFSNEDSKEAPKKRTEYVLSG